MGIKKTTRINVNDAGSTLNELDINDEISIKIRDSAVSGFKNLVTQPDEVGDLFLVYYYMLWVHLSIILLIRMALCAVC